MSQDPKSERMFPIMVERAVSPHLTRIPWSVAEKAYAVYASKHGTQQTLERIAERGGFWVGEMDSMYPNWRKETDRIEQLEALVRYLVKSLDRIRELSNLPGVTCEADIYGHAVLIRNMAIEALATVPTSLLKAAS